MVESNEKLEYTPVKMCAEDEHAKEAEGEQEAAPAATVKTSWFRPGYVIIGLLLLGFVVASDPVVIPNEAAVVDKKEVNIGGATEIQYVQSAPLAVPQLGSCTFCLRARLVASCSSAIPGWPLATGIPATASVLELAASKVAHSTAFVHSGDWPI